jgi:phosphoribosylglycinamide formyltransferase 1
METTNRPIRLGVLLSGGGRTLLNVLDYIRAGKLSAEVAVVVASRDCLGLTHATAAGLNAHLVPYKQTPQPEYSHQITRFLDEAKVELVCMAGFLSFWHIPPQYQGKVINIHPALLPSFGGKGMHGRHVHEAVLRQGCKVSGCTAHFVNHEYDQGAIIVQRAVPVLEGDSPDTLAARVFEQECIAFPEAIVLFAQGRLRVEGRIVHILPGE